MQKFTTLKYYSHKEPDRNSTVSTRLLSSSRSNSFTYNENGMYSQSGVPAYIDSSGHHLSAQNAPIYQNYQTQGGQHMSSPNQGVGVNPQAVGVAQQAYLTPGQSAHQRVPISHTTRASPATVRKFLFLFYFFHIHIFLF